MVRLAAIQIFSVFEWFHMLVNWTIQKMNFKMFDIQMFSIFEWSVGGQYSSPDCISSCPYIHSRLNDLCTMLMSPSQIVAHRISCNSNITLCSIPIKTLFFQICI